ncbi:MAG: tyrosine-type recombinase/integrase [Heliomarina sp.]|uniref:tyrosine-type recombinase/integrase n=1 Tax=Heliomarina sp. TaxID=2917556 RepID=UPI0040589FD1
MENKILKNVHRVTKTLKDGTAREYHYCFRGGPRFWSSTDKIKKGSKAYESRYEEVLRSVQSLALKGKSDKNSTRAKVAEYRESAAYQKLAPRTKADYEKYLRPFEEEFGSDPIKMFEEVAAVAEINNFKKNWAHSPRQYDYATAVVTRFLNWCKKTDMSIRFHHHIQTEYLYESDRAGLIWSPEEIQALLHVATDLERRIVLAARGGITPQDLGLLTRAHVEKTPKGRRLSFRRTKTGKPFNIPLTPDLAELVDTMAVGQERLLLSLTGRPLRPERASGIIRNLKHRANAENRGSVREELHLYDMRGTAATTLIRADCSLREVATYMGWGLRHASNIIEEYVRLVPEESDRVAEKLRLFWKREAEASKSSE